MNVSTGHEVKLVQATYVGSEIGEDFHRLVDYLNDNYMWWSMQDDYPGDRIDETEMNILVVEKQ